MRKGILKIFWDFVNSFKTTDGGFSGRKLSAFVATIAAIRISVNQANAENAFLLTCANYLFALLCLGLVTAANLIELRSGSYTKIEKTESVETSGPAEPK